MAAGTPTLSDSFWLSQSTVFKNRVQTSLQIFCNVVSTESPSSSAGGTYVHQQRKAQVALMLNPANFPSWLTTFVNLAASDANVIAAATQSTTNYAPITSAAIGDTAAADGQAPNLTSTLISNAIAASFNSVVIGI
jgi:hypothetical protein